MSAGRTPARERHRYLTTSEVAAQAAACGDPGDVVTIPAFTGLRWSELVGLRVGDIDLAARRLYVRQAAPEVEGRIIVGPPKTRAAVGTVPLPQVVIDALKSRVAGRNPAEHAVTSPNGGFLRSNNWRRTPIGPEHFRNPTGALDDSRPTAHLRQPGPSLRR